MSSKKRQADPVPQPGLPGFVIVARRLSAGRAVRTMAYTVSRCQAAAVGRIARVRDEEREGESMMSVNVARAGAPPVDILVTDADTRPIVVVEVKNQEDLLREDAVRLFRDLTSYAAFLAAALSAATRAPDRHRPLAIASCSRGRGC